MVVVVVVVVEEEEEEEEEEFQIHSSTELAKSATTSSLLELSAHL